MVVQENSRVSSSVAGPHTPVARTIASPDTEPPNEVNVDVNVHVRDSWFGRTRAGLFSTVGAGLQRVVGPQKVITRGTVDGRFAFTFDDGPHPRVTPDVLRVLDRYGAKASFFCVGQQAGQHATMLRDLVDAGHEVGSHTNSHASLVRLNSRDALAEIQHGREALEDILGQPCPLFRPPHGLVRPHLLPKIWAAGNVVVLWTISSKDYADYPVAALDRRLAKRGLFSGDIVLLHDTNDAAASLVDAMCQRGQHLGLTPHRVTDIV